VFLPNSGVFLLKWRTSLLRTWQHCAHHWPAVPLWDNVRLRPDPAPVFSECGSGSSQKLPDLPRFHSRISLRIRSQMQKGFNPWVKGPKGVVWWKNRRSKISWQGPFNVIRTARKSFVTGKTCASSYIWSAMLYYWNAVSGYESISESDSVSLFGFGSD
jgi:hypothetical protein